MIDDLAKAFLGQRLTGEIQAMWLFNLVKKTSPNANICEIGTLYGFLTAVLAMACKESSRRVFTIDHMMGFHCMAQKDRPKCIYIDFVDNMIRHGVWDKIIPFPMKSHGHLDLSVYKSEIELPIEMIRDDYFQANDLLVAMEVEFELIYIDGNHTYENVIKELETYSKFLRPGGLICGDDCHIHDHKASFFQSFLYNKDYFDQSKKTVAMAMLEFFSGNNEFDPVESPMNQFCFSRL